MEPKSKRRNFRGPVENWIAPEYSKGFIWSYGWWLKITCSQMSIVLDICGVTNASLFLENTSKLMTQSSKPASSVPWRSLGLHFKVNVSRSMRFFSVLFTLLIKAANNQSFKLWHKMTWTSKVRCMLEFWLEYGCFIRRVSERGIQVSDGPKGLSLSLRHSSNSP